MGPPTKGTYFKCKCGKHFRTLADYQSHFQRGLPPLLGGELAESSRLERKAYRDRHYLVQTDFGFLEEG